MGAEYERIQGKKVVLKEHHKMKLHDRVHKKAKKIEAVKKQFQEKGFDSTSIAENIGKKTNLVAQAQKRLNPDNVEKMKDTEGDLEPLNLKKKATQRTEKMGFERAEGMALGKSVMNPSIICLDCG